MFESFDLFVSYSQICVFDPDLVNPFNDWRPEHWQQGFSWRPATVSFRTLVESGITIVEVQTSNEFQIAPTAVRAILVPFEVNPEGVIEISSINRGRKIQMPHGKYTLIFEIEIDNKGRNRCRFLFIRAETAKAQILRKDSNLSPIYPLTMESGPAI